MSIPRFEAKVERRGWFRWRWSVTESRDGKDVCEMYGSSLTQGAAYLMAWRIKEHREIRAIVEAMR